MTKHHAEKLFSFTQWAVDHPSDAIPGDRIDQQFSNHKLAIQSVADALSRLVRADGKLNHDLLTADSLPRELTAELINQARREVEAFASPLFAVTGQRQSELDAAQLDLRARLDETKHRQRDIDGTLAQAKTLQAEVERRVQAAMQQISTSLRDNAALLEDVNWQTLQANTAQDWALVSTTWAEFMDGNATIPPNILAMNSITGDHWSSRWWANRAAGAFGMLAWWYMGAWPNPGPPSTPLTATGQPIPIGAMYFNTDLGTMQVWNGSTWVNLAQGPSAATTMSLYYLSTLNQTVFPLSTADRFGNTFAFNQAKPEGLLASVNGVRLTPNHDFTINISSSTVTLLRPVPASIPVTFDVLVNVSTIAPSGSVNTVLVSSITPNGSQTVFPGLKVAANSTPINVAKNEELSVSVDGVVQQPGASYSAVGDTLTFVTAPDANAVVFIIWYGPTGAGGSAGVVIQGPADLKNQVVVQTGAALTIDRTLGENVSVQLNANVTSIAVASWPSVGVTGKVRLIVGNGGAFTIAGWPAGTLWPSGTPPVMSSGAGKRDIFLLMTDDGGVTIYGSIVGQDYR